jgi:hypothetical protein
MREYRREVYLLAHSELSRAHEGDGKASICRPFLRVAPVTGAAVSTIGSGRLGPATICATDPKAVAIDELQIDLGEGPCWEALRTGQPVLSSNFALDEHPAWPVFAQALREYEVGAIFAFPLTLGGLDVGSIDLYSHTPHTLTETEVSDVVSLTEIAAWQVLRRVLAGDSASEAGSDSDPSPGFSRRQVHQATGMIIAQMEVSSSDALLLLKAHAFASGRSVREIAHDVVTRRLDFAHDRAQR